MRNKLEIKEFAEPFLWSKFGKYSQMLVIKVTSVPQRIVFLDLEIDLEYSPGVKIRKANELLGWVSRKKGLARHDSSGDRKKRPELKNVGIFKLR